MKKVNIITFKSPNDAFQFKDEADTFGLNGRILPTPRDLSVSCSFSYRTEEKEKLEAFLKITKARYNKYIKDYEVKY